MLTDSSTVRSEISNFISNYLLAKNVQIKADTKLKDIGIDSYSIVEIILFIERKYGVIIPEAMLTPENFRSVDTIADCVFRVEEQKQN